MPKSIAIPPKGKPRKAKAAVAAQDETPFSLGPPPSLAKPPRRVIAAPEHRYKVGETLTMAGGSNALKRGPGACIIVALLPYEGHGSLLYRVRSEAESFERIVPEIDLTPPA